MKTFRTGFGFDVHPLVENRDFVLGGVKIPHKKGLLGHSDADVLVHALIDALLGAAALGDIGTQFPDSDFKFKDISSLILLDQTNKLISKRGFQIGNIDTTIVLESPKIREFIPGMIAKLTEVLNIENESISIKAITTEGLGYVGQEEGVAAYASVLIFKERESK